jgi:hypothetical protein
VIVLICGGRNYADRERVYQELIRNQQMAEFLRAQEEGKRLCLAFPTVQSRGTWDMVRKCRVERYRIQVEVIE